MEKHIPDEKLNRADGGFSLLEVIISMAILALVTIPLLNYFTNSLQQSARMAQRQRGTLAAQELTEGLKSVNKLIVVPDDSTEYTVPYLMDLFGASAIQNGSFDTDGKGTVVFEGPLDLDSGTFYARVTISTSVAANAVSRPLVYGIDDSTDLLALERNQETEALVYFTSINSVYCAEHSSVTPLTQDQITAGMKRTIYVEVDHDGTYYIVKVYYEYKCSNLRGIGSEDSFISSCLVDSKIDTLKNLYLLYNSSTAGDSIVLNVPDAVYNNMTIFNDESLYAGSDLIIENTTRMGLYLIAQGLRDDDAYTLDIKGYKDEHYTSIHTNIVGAQHTIRNVDKGNIVKPFLMVSSGTPTRLIKIKAEIFENEHSVSGDPLAVVETTKGE